MQANKVSIVIPCYWANRELFAMTTRCLSGLVDSGCQVIVVADNASYACNVNAGLRAAVGDYLIICNNDVEFIQPDWLTHLLQPLKEGYDISSIRSTEPDGWEVENKVTEGDKFGNIWAMRRQVYEKIGGLDETFGKGYFEDTDYKKRAEAAGFRVAKNHAGIVEHHGKATFAVVDPSDGAYHTAMARYKEKWGQID